MSTQPILLKINNLHPERKLKKNINKTTYSIPNALRDLKMSYPGGNGISIKKSNIDNKLSPEIVALKDFLDDAVSFGVLIEREHSSKRKEDGSRKKYYISSILCPRFQIPSVHTKEPLYWSIENLLNLIFENNITLKLRREIPSNISPDSSDNTPFFPGFEKP